MSDGSLDMFINEHGERLNNILDGQTTVVCSSEVKTFQIHI